MQLIRHVAIALLVVTPFFKPVARADDAKINTPVVIGRLEGSWELLPDQPGAFRQKLHLMGITGTWHQGEKTLPTTIAWFVEGNELRILHYYEPKEPFNYRMMTLTVPYVVDGDTLTLTVDGKPLKWKRVKPAAAAAPGKV